MRTEPFELDPILSEALRAAAEYARYLGSSSVETEHLLLGFLRTGQPVFRGVSNAVIREQLLERIERGTPIDPSRELPFAAGATEALRLSPVGDARIIESKPATSREVVLAILDDSDGIAGRVLRAAGITSSDQLNIA